MPSTLAGYSLKQRLGEASSSAAVYAAEYDGQEVIQYSIYIKHKEFG